MLPNVRINFANGAIGGSAPMDDGCTGLVCNATAVTGKFALETNYLITSLKQLEALGIDASSTGPNANVYKCVSEFYAEAPQGTKLYLRGAEVETLIDKLVDPDNDSAMPLLEYARGAIRTLMVKVTAPNDYSPDSSHGIDASVYDAITYAQHLAERGFLTIAFDPSFTGESGGEPRRMASPDINTEDFLAAVDFLSTCDLVDPGDTVERSEGACVGLVAGRIARIPVHRSIARVKDGAIKATAMYIGRVTAENGSPDIIHDRGFICPRTFVGKGGYFWSDDTLATAASDDYCYIPRRRVADKAYRIAYGAMLEQVSDEIALTADGKIAAAACKNIETRLESAIINGMTVEGNLGCDPDDPNDTGVVAYVAPRQNIAATSRLDVGLRIRPYGYSKHIEVDLGFQTLPTA